MCECLCALNTPSYRKPEKNIFFLDILRIRDACLTCLFSVEEVKCTEKPVNHSFINLVTKIKL